MLGFSFFQCLQFGDNELCQLGIVRCPFAVASTSRLLSSHPKFAICHNRNRRYGDNKEMRKCTGMPLPMVTSCCLELFIQQPQIKTKLILQSQFCKHAFVFCYKLVQDTAKFLRTKQSAVKWLDSEIKWCCASLKPCSVALCATSCNYLCKIWSERHCPGMLIGIRLSEWLNGP